MTNVVTSCSEAGWEKYGRQFVNTFLEHWPQDVKLWVVSESPLVHAMPCTDRVTFLSLAHSDSWAVFNEFVDGRQFAGGDAAAHRPDFVTLRWRERTGYNFRFDAVKFSKKVFAIELVAQRVKTGKLIWVDADTVTFAPVPLELVGQTLPAGHALSCLARVGYHSECGYVGYDLDQPCTRSFIAAFANLYASGEVFKLSEWHDSFIFDHLRNTTMIATYKIPHRSKGHPFINSVLGTVMDHMKGKRKDRGRSPANEQIAHGKLDYWK